MFDLTRPLLSPRDYKPPHVTDRAGVDNSYRWLQRRSGPSAAQRPEKPGFAALLRSASQILEFGDLAVLRSASFCEVRESPYPGTGAWAESVRLRSRPFAGTLFAAADGRLRGLTRRYACSLSATCVIPERKLLTVSERPTRRWRRSGRAAPRRSAILRSPTSRWPQQCSVQKAAEPKETAESGSAHAPSDHGASSG